jgi:signal transduction histidine kinase
MATALALAAASLLAGAPDEVSRTFFFAGCLGFVTIASGVWWRRWVRRDPARSRGQFAMEQLLAGIALAGGVAATVGLLRWRESAAPFDAGPSVLFPFDATRLVELFGVLFAEIAILWLAAAAAAFVSGRWRPAERPSHAVAAVLLWLSPAVLLLSVPWVRIPRLPAAALLSAAVLFGLLAPRLRRYYGRTTQSARLGLGLLALVAPLVATYPLTAVVADETTRGAIETLYSPAAVRHPEELRQNVARAQGEIDALEGLAEQLRVLLPGDSRMAFSVWNRTSLSRTRVSSDVELYGTDRRLVSRFSLNLSDYLYRTSRQTWTGSGCAWNVSGEVVRVVATDRPMLHAERGVCDAEGTIVGAVVVHVAPTDYQALPFVSSPNPYYEVFGTPTTGTAARPRDLQLVVYGWSLRPIFVSNPELATWPIDGAIGDRLYRSLDPFWTTFRADDQIYNVYFSQSRSGIYALGYPRPTIFGHLARLAEILALTAVLFVAVQIGALLLVPFARRRHIPLGTVIQEVRTSFYRKLFLFFVFVAIGPVLLFAFAFGAYMTAKLRAGVEEEAKNVVVVARRVFEEVASATSSTSPGPVPATDDVMVWIRQVIGQDVNVFDGATLAATSQRDLFNSGLLQTRTPASVYRAVTLDRRPTFVTEDRLGVFTYLVAAAPVGPPGRETTLVVPLAPRQRAIEREIDDFYRGVLVGAVVVVLFAAALGASLAGRVADPVARLTRATRQIAAGRDDVRVATDTVDELRRLVDDFNVMAETLVRQRAELARTNQLKAWNEMARQVAHEIKNPLTPVQLSAEHLLRVHTDQGRPLGPVFDQCLDTILGQVRLLRQIASDFANFATEPSVRIEPIDLGAIVRDVVTPYQSGMSAQVAFEIDVPGGLPPVGADRTLLARALTNVVENAVQAMPEGGVIRMAAASGPVDVRLTIADSGVGMDAESVARAFEPYFSTKTGGSGLGLANAKRNIERSGGTIAIASEPGAGTTVTVVLPSTPPSGAPASA